MGEHCGNTFEDFAENSNSLRELCPQEDCCSYIKGLSSFMPHFVDVHINDQAHCVFLPAGEALVDYIGATATVDDDWVEIVASINKRAGTDFVAGPVSNPNGHGDAAKGKVENSCEFPEIMANFNKTTLYNIASQYAMDVLRYGYL